MISPLGNILKPLGNMINPLGIILSPLGKNILANTTNRLIF